MECHKCKSDEGIDPFDDGSVMCLKCFEKGLKETFTEEVFKEAMKGPSLFEKFHKDKKNIW